jgi:thioredoxin 1
MSELNITKDTFQKEVLESDKPVIVDFWATWCGPCRMVAPIVEQLAKEYEGKAVIAKCNVEEADQAPVNYGIRNIPTLLFFKDGELTDKMVGSNTKEAIEAKLKALL